MIQITSRHLFLSEHDKREDQITPCFLLPGHLFHLESNLESDLQGKLGVR